MKYATVADYLGSVMHSLRLLTVTVLAVVLVLSSVQNAFAVTELAYDSGIQAGASSFKPNLAAVKFVLADFGIFGSVNLLRVKFNFFISAQPQAVRIYIYAGDGVTQLCCTPTLEQAYPNGWNQIDVSALMTAPIAESFYVAYTQPYDLSSALRYDNLPANGHSYVGTAGAWGSYHNNWMIRADVDPLVQSPGPVGGFMEPISKLTVAVPYLALFGLVAVVTVVAVAPWKKPDN